MAESDRVAPFSVVAVVIVLFIIAAVHRNRRKRQRERSQRDIEANLDVIEALSFVPAAAIRAQPVNPLTNNVAARASVDSQLPVYVQPLAEPAQPELPPPPPYAPEDPAPRVTKPPNVLIR